MTAPPPLDFFGRLVWLDGRPLLDTIEPYRARTFTEALYTFDDARPQFNLVLCGRAKKNFKTTDLILAALYRFLVWPSDAGNDCFVLANDEEQAGDDLSLAKKLVDCNPVLSREVEVKAKAIVRRDGRGTMQILPAGDIKGAHGKTYIFCGFDEIHAYRNHDLFEALAPDPSRPDALIWITSYAGIRHAPGIPLYDFMAMGREGDDPRFYFSWYGGDFSTDPDLADPDWEPEERANPSRASWQNNSYLGQQKKRLPAHKYRRLHLNLPGSPEGAAYSGEHVMAAIVTGRKVVPRRPHVPYFAFVDMSGGSSDDACLAIAHAEEDVAVLDLMASQTGAPPFSPRQAVEKFCGLLKSYGLRRVSGDAYGGLTFRQDFQAGGVEYVVVRQSKSDLYEAFEPMLTNSSVELLDVGKLQEQLMTLVWRGQKIDHQNTAHDDFANAAVGALVLAAAPPGMPDIPPAVKAWAMGVGMRSSGGRYNLDPMAVDMELFYRGRR